MTACFENRGWKQSLNFHAQQAKLQAVLHYFTILFQSFAEAFSFLSNETCDKLWESGLQKKKKKIILQLVCASPTEPAKKENLSLLKQVLRRMCNHVLKDALDQGSVRLLIVDR